MLAFDKEAGLTYVKVQLHKPEDSFALSLSDPHSWGLNDIQRQTSYAFLNVLIFLLKCS